MWRVGALLAPCVLSLAGAALAAEDAARDDSPVARLESLKARIEALMLERRIPGASIALVARDRELWVGGLGRADLETGEAVSASTVFRLGSMSKGFTALAVLTAVEDGRLDLEMPVRRIAPEVPFENPWESTHPVTIAEVMEHTAGFDDIPFSEYADVERRDISLLEGLAAHAEGRVSRWRPGTYASYCNAGPAIAAYCLQKRVGRLFEDYVRERVFDVLGMRGAAFRQPRRMARGYDTDGVKPHAFDHITIRPAAGASASAADVARYLRMLLGRGELDGVRLLRPESITRMETPKTTLAAHAGHSFGYGLGVYSMMIGGHRFFGHNGGITGFVGSYAYSPELGVGFYFNLNAASDRPLEIVTSYDDIALFRELLGGYVTAGYPVHEPPPAALDADELCAVTGFYQGLTSRMQVGHALTRFTSMRRVTSRRGRLFLESVLGGRREELIPVSATSFRRAGDSEPSLFQVVDPEGRRVGQWGPDGNVVRVPGAWIATQLAAAAGVIALVAWGALTTVAWVPLRWLGGRQARSAPLWPLLPSVASLGLAALAAWVWWISGAVTYRDLGTPSPISLGIQWGTLAVAFLTLVGVAGTLRHLRAPAPWAVRAHAVLVSLACTGAVLYLWSEGLLGLRTWALRVTPGGG